LLGVIERLKTNDEEYEKIIRIAKENVRRVLYSKRAMINIVTCSILGALRENPEKQLLIYDSWDDSQYGAISIPPGIDLLQYRRICLEDLQEEAYDRLSNSIVAYAMSYLSPTGL